MSRIHSNLHPPDPEFSVAFLKMCVASWSWWFRTALLRALRLSLRLTFYRKRSATPQTLIFALIIPHTSLYGIYHCLWMSAVNTSHVVQISLLLTKLTLFSTNCAFRVLFCVWISMFIRDMKIAENINQNLQTFQCSRRPTASSRQSAANQHRVLRRRLQCIM